MSDKEHESRGVVQIHESRGNIHDAKIDTFKPIIQIRNRNEQEERKRRELEETRKNTK